MKERIKHWIVRQCGGWNYQDVQAAINRSICCEHPGCYMLAGHGGPPRDRNGLAQSTNRRKARQAERAAEPMQPLATTSGEANGD